MIPTARKGGQSPRGAPATLTVCGIVDYDAGGMRALLTLLRNLTHVLFVGTQNLLKSLWVKPPAPDYVVFELTGDPPYRPRPWRRRLLERLSGAPPTLDLHTLAGRLDRIGRASHVRGVVLRLTDLRAGLAKIDALRELLAGLRARGKEVVLWTASAGGGTALLLLAGDRIFLAPAGRLDLKGFAMEVTSARRALEKVGAEAVVFRRGTHKSAGEVFTRDGMSPEHRETLDAILDALWARLVQAVAEGRKVDEAAARALVEGGPYTARKALEAGLVDGLCYGDEVPARLSAEEGARARLVPWEGFRATILEPLDWRPVLGRRRRVAVVPIRGLIVEGESRRVPGGGPMVGARSVGETLAAARRDPSVRAVVLHVDSRGGSALASDLIWREVRRTAEKKPVVAFLDGVAASGGYYVSAGASRIVASPLVLTGSIGVLAAFFDLSGLYARLGVTREVLARGPHAALGTSSRPPTEAERALMERELDDVYGDFVDRVARGRALTDAEVRERAEGKVYVGTRAKELGLVDELGGFEAAVARARELAGLAPGVESELALFETRAGGLPVLGRPMGPALPGDAFDRAWALEAGRRPRTAWAVLPVAWGA